MDTTEAADIAMTRLDRPHEIVAFEAAALRGLIDRLGVKGRELTEHIIATTDGTDPLAMTQAAGALAVLEMCESLGFDPNAVLNITVEPDHVEVTVAIPIVNDPDDEHPTPPNYTTQDGWVVDRDH
jgi:hypothetical protein